jgi:fatty acid desaturase
MSLDIQRDPRVRSVAWRDLMHLSRREVVTEVVLSLPWLAASFALASMHWYIPALGFSFIFFLTGLRQTHNAYHYAMGLSRQATEWVIFALSVLMLGSMHAVQITHLHHHKHCMDDEDVEAASARMSALKAFALGPSFPIRLHIKALQLATPKQKVWIYAELATNVVWIALVLGVLKTPILIYHLIAMTIGQSMTAFFAVWTVHHDCDRSHFIARTLRSRLKSFIAFDMFFHIEHHLFPRVPTCHLSILSQRLDQAAPELQQKQVF